jgi:hypothetical protein
MLSKRSKVRGFDSGDKMMLLLTHPPGLGTAIAGVVGGFVLLLILRPVTYDEKRQNWRVIVTLPDGSRVELRQTRWAVSASRSSRAAWSGPMKGSASGTSASESTQTSSIVPGAGGRWLLQTMVGSMARSSSRA